jgi:Ca2+-dependent lipid-binding protein
VKTKIGKTKYLPRTLHPQWDHVMSYNKKINETDRLKFHVYDHDSVGSDDSLGVVKFDCNQFFNHRWCDDWYRLRNAETGINVRGYLRLKIHYHISGGKFQESMKVDIPWEINPIKKVKEQIQVEVSNVGFIGMEKDSAKSFQNSGYEQKDNSSHQNE